MKDLAADDRLAILDLLARFTRAQDDRNPAAYDDIFTEDAVCEFGRLGVFEGRDVIRDFLGAALLSFSYTQHRVIGTVIEGTPTGASTRTYYSARHVRPGVEGGETCITGGEYFDEFVRADDGWRMSRRRIASGFMEGNPEVMALLMSSVAPRQTGDQA